MSTIITRAEIIESLREGYAVQVEAYKKECPGFVGWPDMEFLLDYIEEHGLPPKKINFTLDLPE